jgi:hypothetical protein
MKPVYQEMKDKEEYEKQKLLGLTEEKKPLDYYKNVKII